VVVHAIMVYAVAKSFDLVTYPFVDILAIGFEQLLDEYAKRTRVPVVRLYLEGETKPRTARSKQYGSVRE